MNLVRAQKKASDQKQEGISRPRSILRLYKYCPVSEDINIHDDLEALIVLCPGFWKELSIRI